MLRTNLTPTFRYHIMALPRLIHSPGVVLVVSRVYGAMCGSNVEFERSKRLENPFMAGAFVGMDVTSMSKHFWAKIRELFFSRSHTFLSLSTNR